MVIGRDITLTCSASGIHLPNITWNRRGESIARSSRKIISQSVVNETILISDFVISSSEQTDTGNYSCSANNSAGVDTKLFYLQVLGMCKHYQGFIYWGEQGEASPPNSPTSPPNSSTTPSQYSNSE